MDFLSPFAQFYYFAYWFIVMLLTVSRFNAMWRSSAYEVIENQDVYRPILAFSIMYILFWGLRPISGVYFGDTANYATTYRLLEDFGVFNMQGSEDVGSDWLFNTLMRTCAQVMNVHFFFTIIMFLYIIMMFGGCRKIDYQHGALLMLFCIGSFEFYPYSVNGIRNGVACSFAIMALAYLCKEKKVGALVWSFIAIGFHKSAALPVAAMFLSYYVSKPKYMYIAWLGAIVVSLAIGGYIDTLLSAMSYDERLAGNLQGDDADGVIMEHRFRWDFLLYSSMPILLGWYTIFKRQLFDKTYLILLGTYIYANAFWVLAIRGMFSNRIAYLSWFIYPIVLAYPLLNFPVFKQNHSEKTAWILLGHFGFTSFLWMIGKN